MIDWKKTSRDVRIARASKGVDQKDASAAAGVSASTLCRLEKGKTVSADSFMAICAWLGVPAETMLLEKK